MLDDADRRILRQYQADPAASAAQLAERAGLTQATCWRRIERMQEQGIIRATRAVINWQALGYEVEVSLRITLDKTQPRAFEAFATEARKIPEVLEIQTFLGQVDARLGVIARDMLHYQEIYRSRILPLPHITDLDALMHISRIKYDESVPL
jgi:Lrp/AsnC family transcriptional regulator